MGVSSIRAVRVARNNAGWKNRLLPGLKGTTMRHAGIWREKDERIGEQVRYRTPDKN